MLTLLMEQGAWVDLGRATPHLPFTLSLGPCPHWGASHTPYHTLCPLGGLDGATIRLTHSFGVHTPSSSTALFLGLTTPSFSLPVASISMRV